MKGLYIVATNGALDLNDTYLRSIEEQVSIGKQLAEQNLEDYVSKAEKLQRENDFLKSFIQRCGFDISLIEQAFTESETFKVDHAIELNSDDFSVREKAIQEYINHVSGFFEPIINSQFFQNEREDYQKQLETYLTKTVWSRLSQETQVTLVTAQYLFDILTSPRGKTFQEYSCICMLLSKAVEIEVTKRTYDNFIEHLKRQRVDEYKWPKALLYKESTNPIERKDFTLGNAIHVVGLINTAKDDEDPVMQIQSQYCFNMFNNYYKNKYFYTFNQSELRDKILNDGEFIEVVRIKYRNPSAHKATVQKELADDCIRYILTDKGAFAEYLREKH